MLVLSRKTTQSINIGSNVCVSILGINGSTVRIGIKAPIDIVVLRSELEFKGDSLRTHDEDFNRGDSTASVSKLLASRETNG